MTNEADRTTSEQFPAGGEDLVILPIVAIALTVKVVLRSAWIVLLQLIDFLFPVLLQLMRFPLFTLRILGDGAAALLKGIARILPIGSARQTALPYARRCAGVGHDARRHGSRSSGGVPGGCRRLEAGLSPPKSGRCRFKVAIRR